MSAAFLSDPRAQAVLAFIVAAALALVVLDMRQDFAEAVRILGAPRPLFSRRERVRPVPPLGLVRTEYGWVAAEHLGSDERGAA